MPRTNKPLSRESQQIGVRVNPTIWREIRLLAMQQDKTATELLNQAMEDFVKKHKKGRG